MKKILTIIIISFSLVLTSCTDWLDLKPYSSESDQVAITEIKDGQIALLGVYDYLRSPSFYGREAIACGDAGTPDVVQKIPNSNRYSIVYNWQNPQPGGSYYSDIFIIAYRAIDAANKIIRNIEPIEPATDDDKQVKNQILGETYFLRSLLHFEVMKYFAQAYNYTANGDHLGIVYMLEPTQSDDHARLNAKESFEHIIADAKEALTLMNVVKKEEPFTAGKAAVNALLARVYLYKACTSSAADFDEALKYAKDVINTNEYKLATPEEYAISGTDEFSSKMWLPAAGFSSESIFTLPYTATERNYTNHISRIYLDDVRGYGDLLPSNEIVALIASNPTDVRNTIFYNYAYTAGDVPCVRKFFGTADNWDLCNINIFRISELYLIAAESALKCSSPDKNAAIGYINALRYNRNVSTLDSNTPNEDVLNTVMLERRKELCFEGHRLADLKRLNLGVVRGQDSNNAGNQNYGVAYPDYRFAYPIPEHEMNVNDLIDQNPGYGN
ncbi:MAG: RagB/SusD family nutrient uptake outer membrane protein [Prevotellaceae bacterium]|nr:RagB/SusD family nutrient uptake outer membrane protein [Prevotellaceae bacterium]